MNWYRPNPIKIPRWLERWATFDSFADPDRRGLTLISPTYPKTSFTPLTLRIRREGRHELVGPDDVRRVDRTGFPVMAHYPVDLTQRWEIDLRVGWRRHPIVVNEIPPRPKPIRLAMSTMFRHDYWALPVWLDHYRSLGVDWFFLYFNSSQRVLERSLAERGGFDFSDCTFVEWPFSRFIQKELAWRRRRIRPIYGRPPNFHHAQPAEMLHAATAFARHWEIPWMAYFDLDEFAVLKRWADIPEFLEDDASDVNLIECRWAEDRGDWARRDRPFKRDFTDIYARPYCEGPSQRTKCILRTECMIMPDIHFPFVTIPDTKTLRLPPGDAHFLHFHHFTNDRKDFFHDREAWEPYAI